MALVERDAPETLTRQVYRRVRDMILDGKLAAGSRVTSTRRMAQDLGVSRNVVLNAFDQLYAEGYLVTRAGAGTFVAQGVRRGPGEGAARGRRTGRSPTSVSSGLVFGPTGPAAGLPPLPRNGIDFRSGLPELSLFPVKRWQRLSREVWESIGPRDLSYGQPEGRPELRIEVARYVAEHRGVRCDPDQVVITAGTTQAAGIATRVLVGRGHAACIVEDPLTSDIKRIVAGAGGSIVPVPVGDRGLAVERLPAAARPAMIYVTPSHQFPLGSTMPIASRLRLLEYARARGAYVVEDDYDSEFRYDSPPLSSIQGLDPGRVLYIGTFSKTLCPALRTGYLILPPGLVERGRQGKWFADLHNPSPDQIVLARFLEEGHFARYVHRMGKVYRARRAALVASLRRHFGNDVEILGSPAGIHLCARFARRTFDHRLVTEI
ncbi:MAG TPA: PLP-dependent aminotransferase family protein, partial [Spirochaetia bacterium]